MYFAGYNNGMPPEPLFISAEKVYVMLRQSQPMA